jgi:hypothetical protein
MMLILLSWLYVFVTASSLGISFAKLLGIPLRNITFTSVLGLFAATLLASIWAIFGPINSSFAVFLTTVSLLSWYNYKADWHWLCQTTVKSIRSLSLPLKILLSVTSVLLLAQSSTAPFVIDNETYYLQTIKWLNEYGFVPGLANLHLFFGQTSGWHVAQSVYSLSFLYGNFNDLNGYLLLLFNVWSFQRLHTYSTSQNKIDLVFGLLPLSYLFLFQFVNAPSPDLAVYSIAFLAFSVYTSDENATEKLKVVSALFLFAVYIKITAVVLLLLPIIIWIRHHKQINNPLIPIRLLAGLVVLLFVMKNSILTGYPLYPLTFLPNSDADYVVPKDILLYFFSNDMMHSFYLPFGTYDKASLSEIIKAYFLYNGIDSLIGCVTLLLVMITPFILKKYYPKQGLADIYWVFVLLLILLIMSSPQYRFYVYFTIFFGLLTLAVVLSGEKIRLAVLGLSCLGCAVMVLVPISFSNLTNNVMLTKNSTLEANNLFFPKPNSKKNIVFTIERKGNLQYNTPQHSKFFWITGNGALPTVSKDQLNYFETYFHVIPQRRGKTLSEGFKAQKVNGHD